MNPNDPSHQRQSITLLGIFVGMALTLAVGYALRKQVFHHTGMSLQKRLGR